MKDAIQNIITSFMLLEKLVDELFHNIQEDPVDFFCVNFFPPMDPKYFQTMPYYICSSIEAF